MKKYSLLSLFFVSFFSLNILAQAGDLPARTVLIKNPAAENPTTYFSTGTTFYFEVYKVGTASDIEHIVKTFEQDPAVASILPGKATGDYQSFSLSLKTPQNKAWFSMALKNANLTRIRLNRHEVTAVDKL